MQTKDGYLVQQCLAGEQEAIKAYRNLGKFSTIVVDGKIYAIGGEAGGKKAPNLTSLIAQEYALQYYP